MRSTTPFPRTGRETRNWRRNTRRILRFIGVNRATRHHFLLSSCLRSCLYFQSLLLRRIMNAFSQCCSRINYIIISKKNRKEQQQEEKTIRPPKKSQKMSLGPYDKIKKCSDCHPESSHTCKNSSRRTPRPKNRFS